MPKIKSFFFLLGLSQVYAKAEDIHIYAGHSLEYFLQDRLYIAKGSAWIRKGSFLVKGDLIKIYLFQDSRAHKIKRIEALSHALCKNPHGFLQGERLVYETSDQSFEATGHSKLTTPEGYLTAHTFHYWPHLGQGQALGRASWTQGERLLKADSFKALFFPGSIHPSSPKTSLALLQLEAKGHVCLIQSGQALYSSRALYDAKRKRAYFEGKVTLIQGQGIGQGGKASYDAVSQQAHLSSGKGRVRFLIYPSKRYDPKS